MEHRAPRNERVTRRRARPLLLLLSLAIVAALAATWLLAGYDTDDEVPAGQTRLTGATTTQTQTSDTAALIVDEADRETAEPAVVGPAREAVSSAGTDTPVAAAHANGSSDNPFADVATPTRGAAPSRRSTLAPKQSRAPPTGAARKATSAPPPPTKIAIEHEPDLLNTLLENIEKPTDTNAPARDHAALDALMKTVNEPRTSHAGNRSEQVQSRLRQCPRPTTTAGLQCRRKVCVQYAGQDAACPHR